jgi:hypothetical protein
MLETTDPAYPHGSVRGYNDGCHRDSPCPATPTCHEVKRARQQAHRAANPGRHTEHPDWPQTSQVQKRLAETVRAVGYAGIIERTGVSRSAIKRVVAETKARIDPRRAEPLDHAWSYFTRGVDTLAPDFIHGRVTSYTRYSCRCTSCRVAAMRAQSKARAGHQTPHNIVAVPNLAAHVEALLRAGGPCHVANAADVAPQSVKGARAGERVRIAVARKLLACTPEDVARAVRRAPAARVHQRLRSMYALGYPLAWLAEQEPELTLRKLSWMRADGQVLSTVAEAVNRLADRIGDTPATPGHGISAKAIAQARTNARRQGHYPPAFYDEDGVLDVRSVPGHPWAVVDDAAALVIEQVREVTRPTMSRSAFARLQAAATGEAFETMERQISRVAHKLAIRGEYDPDADTINIVPECRTRAAALHTHIVAYDDGEAGPLTTLLALGLSLPQNRAFPPDHPEVIRWAAQQSEVAA